MYFWKGRVKVDAEVASLAKEILEKNGLKAEEEGNILYFYEEKDPFFYNRTRAEAILKELQEIGAEAEIEAFSVVEIFKGSTKDSVVEG